MPNWLPNLLTILRIIAAPVTAWFLLKKRPFYLRAGILFSLSSLTDFFDGYLARKFNACSRFGQKMDPIADKLATGSILVPLALRHPRVVPRGALGLILLREIMISWLRKKYGSRNSGLTVSYGGKIKTALQMSVLVLSLLHFSVMKRNKGLDVILNRRMIRWAHWFVAVFTAITGLDYLRRLYWPRPDSPDHSAEDE